MDIKHTDIIGFYNRSLSFFEQSRITAKCDSSELYSTEEYQNTTAYLLYHSIELFLKFAILARTEETDLTQTCQKFSHNFSNLYKTYTSLYTENEYKITLPFIDDLFSQIKNFDQILKYPKNRDGKSWGKSILIKFDDCFYQKMREDIDVIAYKIMDELEEKGIHVYHREENSTL